MIEGQDDEREHIITAEIQVIIKTTSCEKAGKEFGKKMVQLFNDYWSDPNSNKAICIGAYVVNKIERLPEKKKVVGE